MYVCIYVYLFLQIYGYQPAIRPRFSEASCFAYVCVTRPAGAGGGFRRSESTKEVGEAPKFQGKKQSRRVLPVVFFVGISSGSNFIATLGPQNLAEEGDYLREIQVGEMIIILARYLPWNYLYERGWVRLPTTYVFPIGHVENQWSFCWLGGVKVVQGDRSDGRILQTETRGGKLAGVKLEEANKDTSPRLQLMLLLGCNITPGAKFVGPARVPDLTSLGL